MLMQKAYQFLLCEDICPSTFQHGSSNSLDICPVALVDLMVELREEIDNLLVILQHVRSLQFADTVSVDDRYLILQKQGINTHILVVRPYSNEQEAEGFHLLRLEGFEEMVPSEGE